MLSANEICNVINKVQIKYTNHLIYRWKIDSEEERELSILADNDINCKRKYCEYYIENDREYFEKGMPMLQRSIDKYLPSIHLPESFTQRKNGLSELEIDMLYSLHRFGCMFDEYFLFEYYKLNTFGRNLYLTDKIRYSYYDYFNEVGNEDIFWNKGLTYRYFQKYFKRDCISIESIKDEKKFVDYLRRHNGRVVIKPLCLSIGRGVQCVNAEYLLEKGLIDIFNDDGYKNGFILEELVNQVDEMGKLHPLSLNTVRIVTIRTENSVIIQSPFWRIGQGNSFVDNANAGGLIAAIDPISGIVTNVGSKMGQPLLVHPDTKEKILGYKIPLWNEAVNLAKELTEVVPTTRYTGWDLALTENGWVLIEANSTGGPVGQYVTKVGLKPQMNSIIDKENSQIAIANCNS